MITKDKISHSFTGREFAINEPFDATMYGRYETRQEPFNKTFSKHKEHRAEIRLFMNYRVPEDTPDHFMKDRIESELLRHIYGDLEEELFRIEAEIRRANCNNYGGLREAISRIKSLRRRIPR